MSKKGLLKAEFNRVRTSTALKGNDMWTNTIGIEQDPQAGSNAVIEASIYAPQRGGGNRAAERQEKAQQMASQAGYQSMATDYKGLLSLAKAQGIGNELRGACKLCGCLGHLTKKCTNVLTGHNATTGMDVVVRGGAAGAGAAAAGTSGGVQVLGLLPELGDISDLSSSSSSSSDDDSDSGSSSSSGGERKRKRSSGSGKRSSSSGKDKSKSKRHKKEKSKKRKHKSSKDKKSSKRRHRSRSP